MALYSDTAMVLYYDVTGDNADHDDWQTYEHIHERLSIPGFMRATRWVATAGRPKYMVLYEVTGTEVATSSTYLARLNNPTPWTASIMKRFRGMIRGFCTVVASSGFGLGNAAVSVRFAPVNGKESNLIGRLTREVLPAISSRRGVTGVHLLQPVSSPPMTKEQLLRGPDTPMTWLLLATAYDSEALERASAEHFEPETLQLCGASSLMTIGKYKLHYTATAQEVVRTAPGPTLHPSARQGDGMRR